MSVRFDDIFLDESCSNSLQSFCAIFSESTTFHCSVKDITLTFDSTPSKEIISNSLALQFYFSYFFEIFLIFETGY